MNKYKDNKELSLDVVKYFIASAFTGAFPPLVIIYFYLAFKHKDFHGKQMVLAAAILVFTPLWWVIINVSNGNL